MGLSVVSRVSYITTFVNWSDLIMRNLRNIWYNSSLSLLQLQSGQVINTNEIFVIEQEHDSFWGAFDAIQSYIRKLTDLNMWNRAHNASQVSSLSKLCHGGRGNVKKWSDVPSACEIYTITRKVSFFLSKVTCKGESKTDDCL